MKRPFNDRVDDFNMPSTRYSAPVHIFQDPVDSFDHAPMPPMRRNGHNARKGLPSSPLRPIKNVAPRRNHLLQPPQLRNVKQSPFKLPNQSSAPPLMPLNANNYSISMPPPGGPYYNTDSLEKRPPMMAKFKPQMSQFSTMQQPADKENNPVYNQGSHAYDGYAANNFSLEGLYPRPAPKRVLLEAAPIQESRPSKKAKVVEEVLMLEDPNEQAELPAPDSFAPLRDDGSKPSFSYAQLIGMSILRSPNRQLTLAQIYKWITDTFSFYSAAETGWQNSIRHNLSLNKAFVKQERPKDDPGKGNYWVIVPGMEQAFLKDKGGKKTTFSETGPLMSTNMSAMHEGESSQPLFKSTPRVTAQELPLVSSQSKSKSQPPANTDLSSDATIPASDAFAPEEEDERPDDAEEVPSSPFSVRSSPPPMMHSSPPIARHTSRRHDTPPPVRAPGFSDSSPSRSRKRKFDTMDDSGYISSLDSSAMRPHHFSRFLNSDVDPPRLKRGRAEEAIARLRGSSHDSPAKNQFLPSFPSSSPFRQEPTKQTTQMLPPLTPAAKLKAPMMPPPSVSPNTNLQLHRANVYKLIGSPLRGETILGDNQLPWSPHFNMDEPFADLGNFFPIYSESNEQLAVVGDGSPEKRSSKRPRLDRSKSANMLAEITGTGNASTSTPMLKPPTLDDSFFNSPIKGLGLMESPSKLLRFAPTPKMDSSYSFPAAEQQPHDENDEFADFFHDNSNDFEGVDIMQGFGKIGGGLFQSTSNSNAPTRQPLERSSTSYF